MNPIQLILSINNSKIDEFSLHRAKPSMNWIDDKMYIPKDIKLTEIHYKYDIKYMVFLPLSGVCPKHIFSKLKLLASFVLS